MVPVPRLFAALAAIAVVVSPVAASDAPLFLIDSTFGGATTAIYRVVPETGALSPVAELGVEYTPALALAAASATTLYAAGTDGRGSTECMGLRSCLLLRIELTGDKAFPSVTVVGPIRDSAGVIDEVTGLSFRKDGRLYGMRQGSGTLFTVDPDSGAAVIVGTSDLEIHGGDITFDGDDRLWTWTNLGSGSGLYTLDPDTAEATAFEIHPGRNLAGLAALGHGDRLFGSDADLDLLREFGAIVGDTGVQVPFLLDGAPFGHSRGDLDSPFCADDAACDDGDACTNDRCGAGGCAYERSDRDADGAADCEDSCPATPSGAPVDAEGCAPDQRCPCSGPGRPWRNHGEYVACVDHAVDAVIANGGPASAESRVGEAARSVCGKAKPAAGGRR